MKTGQKNSRTSCLTGTTWEHSIVNQSKAVSLKVLQHHIKATYYKH